MEDEGAEGVNWDGLFIEVLEMIFRHLPVNDLLSCSIVSKNWKNAARDVLKRNRECYAHIKDFHRDIEALNEIIPSTSLMQMVNGLHIRTSQQARRSRIKKAPKKPVPTLEEAKLRIHEVLSVQWRYLNLDLGRRCRKPAPSQCDASLLKEVIFSTSGSLEKLVIGQEDDWSLIPCDGNEYSKLKIIQLFNQQYLHNIRTKIFSPTCASKLEEISGAMMVLEGNNPADCFTMKRMKSIMLRSDLEVPEGESKQEAFGNLSGLRRLDLKDYHCNPYREDPEHEQDLPSWRNFVLPFVLRSLDTLEELHMYTDDFCNLFETSQALKFPNLRRLSLATHSTTFIQVFDFKRLNLAKLCPNLEKVEFSGDFDSLGEIQMLLMIPFEECCGLDQSGKPLQIVFGSSLGYFNKDAHACLKFFNAAYTNITQVRILHLKSILMLNSSIWEMNSLEYLEINFERVLIPRGKWEWDLDALLCGIPMGEAQFLFQGRRNENAILNAVMVPIRPSLLDVKSLKELKLTEVMIGRGKIVKHSRVIHVTENLPVRHERELKVTFEGSEEFCNKMKQLRAFPVLCSAHDPKN